MRAVFISLLVALPAAAALAACGDTSGLGAPALLTTDSARLSTPTSSVTNRPTAIDLTNSNAPASPELPGQAGSWDIQLRQSGATMQLAPRPTLSTQRGAGLKLTTNEVENAGRAPRGYSAYLHEAVNIAAGERYYVRSRETSSFACVKYAIVKVLEVHPDSGTATLRIRSNQNCDDERLEK